MASKKSGSGKNSPALPEEVQRLITRKLRQLQREQQKLLVSANQAAYSKLHDEVVANIRNRKLRRAFTSVPLAVYREIVANATAMTKEWPGIVWETIASTLDKAQVLLRDGLVPNKIVDEFSWAVGQHPFTLSYIDPERFKGAVRREAGRYGINQPDVLAEFDSQLGHAATKAQYVILDAANHTREDIGIAIDDYLVTQRQVVQTGRVETDLSAITNPPPVHLPKIKGSAKQRDRRQKSVKQKTGLEVGSPKWREQNARNAANAKHNQPGGSRDKQKRIREIWATGKYSSRDRCAEEECAALGMSYSAARKALRNTSRTIST